MKIDVTRAELGLLLDAIDSHRYWQVSEQGQRSSGFVQYEPTDDNADELARCDALEAKLERLRKAAA